MSEYNPYIITTGISFFVSFFVVLLNNFINSHSCRKYYQQLSAVLLKEKPLEIPSIEIQPIEEAELLKYENIGTLETLLSQYQKEKEKLEISLNMARVRNQSNITIIIFEKQKEVDEYIKLVENRINLLQKMKMVKN